jgi:SlyX protein
MAADERELHDRVTRLEETIAHQNLTIEEMSSEIATQWKTIGQMQTRLERLLEQFRALEDATLEAPPVTRPPHY